MQVRQIVALNDLVLIAMTNAEMPDWRWVTCTFRQPADAKSVQRRCGLKVVFDPQDDSFRLVLISHSSQTVFAEKQGGAFGFPIIRVPRWARAALNLQSAIRARFGFDVVIVDILDDARAREQIAIAVLLDQSCSGSGSCMNRWIPLAEIAEYELGRSERCSVEQLLNTGKSSRGPFSRIGWFDQIIEWVHAETHLEHSELIQNFEQYNVSPTSALIRFPAQNNQGYWFKAATESSRGEFRVTAALSRLFPEHLPLVIAWQEEWSAWLAEDGGQALETKTSIGRRCAEEIVRALGELHRKSIPHAVALLHSGFADQRLSTVSAGVSGLIPYFQEALEPRESIGPTHVDKVRLRAIFTRVEDACIALDSFGIPDALVHNHLNLGNILIGKRGCLFTDWADAGVGNPLVNFGQLCPQLAAQRTTGLRKPQLAKTYAKVLESVVDSHRLAQALDFVPLIALASHLYARKDWLVAQPRGVEVQSALISLLEDMDRAAQIFEIRQTRSSTPVLPTLRECERQGTA